ncbi:MAG: HlyC/CorC family transporter [Anaerolineae bacterium]|nr:HlyC/CorC family transporter [Anaerolineae bacterium]
MNGPDWSVLVLSILFDLALVALRVTFIHVRLPHLADRREQNPAVVDRAIKLLERPLLPATLRVGVILMHFAIAAQVAWLLAGSLGTLLPLWAALLIGVLLLLTLLVLEFALEGVILRHVETWAMRLAPLGFVMDTLLYPLSWLLMKVLGTPSSLQRMPGSVTDDDLRTWVEEGQPEGSLDPGERRMIYSIIQFSDTLCREIMVPRMDVVAVEVNDPIPEVLAKVRKSGHSRLPVYEDSIDNIIGLVYAKDMLRLQEAGGEKLNLRSLLRQVYFVPEAKKVDELLAEMQSNRVHLAIVVDEYGGMAGIVTLEDIVEEIVGEIRDEYDQSEELLYQQVGDQEYLFQGRVDLDDFNDVVGTKYTRDVADTLGGLIYGKVGRVPQGGEQIELDGWQLTVEKVIGRRIALVRVRPVDETVGEEQGNELE